MKTSAILNKHHRDLLQVHNRGTFPCRQHLKQENRRTADTSELAMRQVAEEEEEHERLMEYNRQENLRVAALREERCVCACVCARCCDLLVLFLFFSDYSCVVVIWCVWEKLAKSRLKG